MTDYVKLSPSGGDDTTQINAALASLAGARGPWPDFGPGLFNIPNGITENVPGLIVTGRSTRMQGPTDLSASGTVLKVSVTQGAYTDNIIGGGHGNVRIGAWNFHDQITGIRYPRTFLDVPNPQGYAKMTVTLM